PLRKIIEENHDWYEIAAIAESAPTAYLKWVWSPMKDALESISAEDDVSGKTAYSSDHSLATYFDLDREDRRGEEYALVDSLVYAMRDAAKQDVEAFKAFVQANQSSSAMVVHRLIAIGLCELAVAEPKFALEYLLADE